MSRRMILNRLAVHPFTRFVAVIALLLGGGGDPVAETGGQFNIGGGPDYTASGIFAGAK